MNERLTVRTARSGSFTCENKKRSVRNRCWIQSKPAHRKMHGPRTYATVAIRYDYSDTSPVNGHAALLGSSRCQGRLSKLSSSLYAMDVNRRVNVDEHAKIVDMIRVDISEAPIPPVFVPKPRLRPTMSPVSAHTPRLTSRGSVSRVAPGPARACMIIWYFEVEQMCNICHFVPACPARQKHVVSIMKRREPTLSANRRAVPRRLASRHIL